MDPTEWRQIVAKLNASYPSQEIPPETAAEWYAELAHLDAGDIWLAVRELRKEQRWRPSLAEILAGVKLYRAELASQARSNELWAAQSHRGVPMPPETRQAMQILQDANIGRIGKAEAGQMIDALANRLTERTGPILEPSL